MWLEKTETPRYTRLRLIRLIISRFLVRNSERTATNVNPINLVFVTNALRLSFCFEIFPRHAKEFST
jgi:hypothetical protein